MTDEIHSSLDAIATRVGVKFGEQAVMYQAFVVAEEVGELLKEIRRYKGHGRTGSSIGLVETELADVIISAEVLGRLLNSDLEEVVAWKLDRISERGGL